MDSWRLGAALERLTEHGWVVVPGIRHARDVMHAYDDTRKLDLEVLSDDQGPTGLRIRDVGPKDPGSAPEGVDPGVREEVVRARS